MRRVDIVEQTEYDVPAMRTSVRLGALRLILSHLQTPGKGCHEGDRK